MIAIIIVLFILVIFVKNNNNNYNIDINSFEIEDRITFSNSEIIGGELIEMLIQPGNDWSKLPLSKHFKRKFNSKYGVLGNIKADKIELDPYKDGRFDFDDYSYILITKDLKQTAYIYQLTEKNEMFADFLLVEKYEITDDKGNLCDAKLSIDSKNYFTAMYYLARGYKDEKLVGKSEKFEKEYSHFLDIFIRYSPIFYNRVTFNEKKSSWRKREAYFEVDSKLECKIREYKVKFKLDENGYLDECDAKMLSEEGYKGTAEFTNDKLFYKYSNWDNIRITENFRKKHKN